MKRIAFVTYAKYPNLTEDDAITLPLLQELGIQTYAAIWDEPVLHWEKFDAVILRSCWNYHHKPKVFRRWLDLQAAAGVRLWNPAKIVRWNMDKIYLRDLAARGVTIPKTFWIEAGRRIELASVLSHNAFDSTVIKPAISATAHMTFRTSPAQAEEDQTKLEAILQNSGALVQEFMPEISTRGEWSLLFFEGKYSHAVLKLPRAGDFRVQNDFGGSYQAARPPAAFITQAEAILGMVDLPLLYARVDGMERDGRFVLIELELIEPSLFLGADGAAPLRFAEAIAKVA
ncbi:MAG: ATP-grasp domain-containing protein [bacterium]